eukprot:gene12696-15928_t
MLNMKVYVDTDDDVRLARRIQRDVAERGRDVGGSRRHADIIIPWHKGTNNGVAVDLITQHIRLKLKQHSLIRIYPNLDVIPSSFQIRGMHTIMRDQTTSKNDFVFYSNRLNRLVVEAGLGHLPFREKSVITPTGEAMEAALRECCQGIKIGKILIHRNPEGNQDLVYEKLPSDISDRFVLLLDPVLGTGNTACKAIKVLLDKGVSEEKILFLSIIAAPEGIHQVCVLQCGAVCVLLLDPVLGTGNMACKAIKVLLDKGVSEEKILFLSIIAAPEGIHQCGAVCVLLLDPVLGTGNTACKAIKVLLDKGVSEEKILFLSIIAAPGGIHQVKIITSEIEAGIDSKYMVVPGVGEFGGDVGGVGMRSKVARAGIRTVVMRSSF